MPGIDFSAEFTKALTEAGTTISETTPVALSFSIKGKDYRVSWEKPMIEITSGEEIPTKFPRIPPAMAFFKSFLARVK